MNTHFLALYEIEKLLKKGDLPDRLSDDDCIGICSIGDILYLSEKEKKNLFKFRFNYEDAKNTLTKAINNGKIFIADLTKEQLEESLFLNDKNSFSIWKEAANNKIEPRDSVLFLSLKTTNSTWWTDEVLEEYKLNGN